MTAYKRAALSLRELRKRDREWLLKRLPDAHRSELRKMLIELDEIGIPQGQGWLSELEREEIEIKDGEAGARSSLDAMLIDSIGRADVKQVKRILEKEPDAVVAIVLAGGQWPWSTALLSSYKRLRRQRIETLRRERKQDLPEKVSESVLRALNRRLAWEPAAAQSGLNGKRRDSLLGKERTPLWQK